MNRIQVLVVIGLLAALSGTGAVYQFYVKARIAELAAHEAQAAALESTIAKMEEIFEKTVPEVMISGYRQQFQPWEDAVIRRATFFPAPEQGAEIAVPKEVIPKFYYREQFPEMQRKLEQEAWEKGVAYPQQLTFGAPAPSSMASSNPSADLVSQWLTDYAVGAALVRMLLDANAKSIDEIQIWPDRVNERGREGFAVHTTGYKFTMSMRDVVRFLDKLRGEKQHYTIEGFWIYNRNLRDAASDVVDVNLIVSKTSYLQTTVNTAGAPVGGDRFDVSQSKIKSVFGSSVGKSGFGGQRKQNTNSGGFVKWMLSWFPF